MAQDEIGRTCSMKWGGEEYVEYKITRVARGSVVRLPIQNQHMVTQSCYRIIKILLDRSKFQGIGPPK
jgi:hypothetical protein